MIGPLLNFGQTLIQRLFPDKKERDKATVKLMEMQESGELSRLVEASKVVVAEAQSQSWLARNWRPITMLVFVFIVFNNYVLVPYAHLIDIAIPALSIPEKMWSLLEIGLGGYIVGRSSEKIASILKGRM